MVTLDGLNAEQLDAAKPRMNCKIVNLKMFGVEWMVIKERAIFTSEDNVSLL